MSQEESSQDPGCLQGTWVEREGADRVVNSGETNQVWIPSNPGALVPWESSISILALSLAHASPVNGEHLSSSHSQSPKSTKVEELLAKGLDWVGHSPAVGGSILAQPLSGSALHPSRPCVLIMLAGLCSTYSLPGCASFPSFQSVHPRHWLPPSGLHPTEGNGDLTRLGVCSCLKRWLAQEGLSLQP